MKLDKFIRPYFEHDDKLQVLFLFDPKNDYQGDIDEIADTILVRRCERDWFSQKVWLQEHKEVTPKVLYYPGMAKPESQEEREAFGLMGELLANEELQIDEVSTIIQELNINTNLKPLIQKYISELKRPKTQTSLQYLLSQEDIDENDLQRGIIGAILNAKELEEWTVIMMRLVDFSLDEYAVEWNKRYKRMLQANLMDALNDKVKIYYGTVLQTGSHDELKELALRVKYNIITQGLELNDADPYSVYKIKDASALFNLEQIRKALYNKSKVSTSFIKAMQMNGEKIKERQIVACYGYSTTYSHYNDSLRLCLLSALLNDYLKEGKEILQSLLILDQQTPDSNLFKETIGFLLNGIKLSELIKSYRSFNFDLKPHIFIEKYIGLDEKKEHYSKIDFLYRKCLFHLNKRDLAGDQFNYHSSDKNLYEELDDMLNLLKRNIEEKYLNLVYDLNASWMKSLKAYDFDYKRIKKECITPFPLQYDFFDDHVAQETNKIAVIISDGLRYEVAEELVTILQQNKGRVQSDLGWNLASVPSTTLFGMANLLPCKVGKYLGKNGIELDGISTNGLSNRSKILELSQKDTGKSTKVVSAQEVLKKNIKDNREIFKSSIVYVYHDEIDSMSHSTGHEYHAIEGSETVLADLTKLVNRILSSNVTKIIVTADHGFLYRDSKIEEKDKIDWPSIGSTVEQGARHTITDTTIPVLEQGEAFDLKHTTRYSEDYQVHTPVSTNRLKGRGVTYTYTHGGASLQELVVPVLTISAMTVKETREQKKVSIQLMGDNFSVKSNVLKDIQILQTDSISTYSLQRTVEIGLYEDNKLVSNVKKLVFNRTGRNPSERIFTTSLTLQTKTTGSLLKLKVYDIEDKLNVLIDVSVKNNTLLERDFDF